MNASLWKVLQEIWFGPFITKLNVRWSGLEGEEEKDALDEEGSKTEWIYV